MGPAAEILLPQSDEATLIVLDDVLAALADRIERTRKGRVWNLWINGRPMYVHVEESHPSAIVSAGCNAAEDWDILRLLTRRIAEAVGGVPSEPEK